tara:strand:- start:201 stop:1031 length:831 start_codon:yes stop_codon:yes gene_type:complete
MKKILHILHLLKLSFFAEFILSLYSKLKGNGYKLQYSKPFWSAKTKAGYFYVDYLIDPRQSIETDVFGLYEDIFYNQYTPKPEDIICDIGAGMGHELPIFIDKIGRDGQMYLIEASPSTYCGLKHAIKLNSLTNAKAFNLAISELDEGFLQISDDIENHLGRSIHDDTKSKGSYKDVQQISIDKFIIDNSINKIDLLIVNIEGFENNLIQRFKEIDRVNNIVISCHDFLHYRDSEQFDERFKTFDIVNIFLKENGFKVSSRKTGQDYKDYYLYGTR